MGWIRVRSSGRIQAHYRDAAGVVQTQMFPAQRVGNVAGGKRDAKAWIAEQEGAVRKGNHIPPRAGHVTVRELASDYLNAKPRKVKTEATYEGLLRRLIYPTFGETAIQAVQPVNVQRWVSRLTSRGLSASQVRQAHALLCGMLKMAVRQKRLATNPCDGTLLPKLNGKEIIVLTLAEVERLAAAMTEVYRRVDYAPLVLTLAFGGLRWGEMAALRGKRLQRRDLPPAALLEVAENLSDVNGQLHFTTPKAHRVRRVEIPDRLYKMLEARACGPNDLLFAGPTGAPLRWSNFRRTVWTKAVAKAKLPDKLTPHALRHTCAAILISKGVHPKAIQMHLGHSSITVTMDVYGHLMPGQGSIADVFADQTLTTKALTVVAESDG